MRTPLPAVHRNTKRSGSLPRSTQPLSPLSDSPWIPQRVQAVHQLPGPPLRKVLQELPLFLPSPDHHDAHQDLLLAALVDDGAVAGVVLLERLFQGRVRALIAIRWSVGGRRALQRERGEGRVERAGQGGDGYSRER